MPRARLEETVPRADSNTHPGTGRDDAGGTGNGPPNAGIPKKRGRLAIVSRVLLAVVIAGEIVVALWPPLYSRKMHLWQATIERQKTTIGLDTLRSRLWHFRPASPEEADLRTLLLDELNRMARYLRTAQESLDRAQWKRFQENLHGLSAIADRLTRHQAVPPLPAIDYDAAVRALLSRRAGGGRQTGTPEP